MKKSLVIVLVLVSTIVATLVAINYNWALAVIIPLAVILLLDIIYRVKEDHTIFKIWKKEIKQKDENKERPY